MFLSPLCFLLSFSCHWPFDCYSVISSDPSLANSVLKQMRSDDMQMHTDWDALLRPSASTRRLLIAGIGTAFLQQTSGRPGVFHQVETFIFECHALECPKQGEESVPGMLGSVEGQCHG